MRKLKLQVQLSIDGFISGPNNKMDWMKFPWTEDIINYVGQLTTPIGTILLGKNLAQGFIPHWQNVASNSENPEYEAGKKFTETPKVVFTKTLDHSIWENTVIAKGDLVEEVNALKQKKGGDIMAYGGGTFVSTLIENNLIDEYYLFINPTAIGQGMPIFNLLKHNLNLNLEACIKFECGILLVKYSKL